MEAAVSYTDRRSAGSARRRSWVLFLLVLTYMFNFIDRSILNTVGQAIKQDLALSDLELGLAAGLAFNVVNGVLAIPVARLAERYNRTLILSAALTGWSIFTALCGTVQSFGQLVFARLGVGAGEAGSVAIAHSLIADHFSPRKRALALSVFVAGVPIGIILGAIGSGWLTQTFSWRAAFVVVGLPGVALALLLALTTRDPPRGHADDTVAADTPSLRVVLTTLFRSQAYVQILLAGTLLNLAYFGMLPFLHPFFVRVIGIGYAEAATLFGLVVGIASLVGLLLGGALTDRLARSDGRYYGWVPATGAAIAGPSFVVGLLQDDWGSAAIFLMIGAAGASAYYGPAFSTIHNMVGPRMRASSTAITGLVWTVIGGALGPLLVGGLSDVFTERALGGPALATLCAQAEPLLAARLSKTCSAAAAHGLRAAMIVPSVIYFWSAIHFWLAARHLDKRSHKPDRFPPHPIASGEGIEDIHI